MGVTTLRKFFGVKIDIAVVTPSETGNGIDVGFFKVDILT